MWTLLGWMSRFAAWTSRFRQHVFPTPVWALLALLCLFLAGLAGYAEANANAAAPQRLTPSQLLSGDGVRQEFVEVEGTPLPEKLGEAVPYADAAGAVVYVQNAAGGPPRGMLRFTEPRLERAMPPDGPTRHHLRTQYVAADERPASVLPACLLTGFSLALGLPLLGAMLAGFVIFQPGREGGAGSPGLLVSGRWQGGRLLHAPATWSDGAVVVGEQREELAEASALRSGVLFLGGEQRPALDLLLPDARKRNRRLTLSFGDAAERDRALEAIRAKTL